ncbi:MAG: aromatic ring-hydroxylating dioxygenase subunit alpha [Pseudomonadota bacterium]
MASTKEQLEQLGFETSLHVDWYRNADHYALEVEHIFLRDWFCVGRSEQWPEPGDHGVLERFGESLLIVRNGEGQLKAVDNLCRHRGARLCDGGEDTHEAGLRGGLLGRKLIRCPYHAWTYDLDGRLINAPFLDDQPGFDPSEIALHPVALAEWGGFVFLCLTPESAPDFANLVAGPAARIVRYPLADLRVGHSIDYPVAANWKVLCENYNECYHCGPVHPELCAVVPTFREGGGSDLDWARGIPHREGATTFTASGETERRSFPGLDEDEQTRHKGELLLPNLFLSLSRDHVAAFILTPSGVDRTEVTCLFLFEPFELEQEGFDPSDAGDFWDVVNRQDWAVCERVQQGMGVEGFRLRCPVPTRGLEPRCSRLCHPSHGA